MNALLRKDWRLYRPTIIGCLVVLAGACLIGVLPLIPEDPRAGPCSKPRQVVNVALLATGVTARFAAVFGASVFAVERRDRTAEFLLMLPIRRTHILASKAAVAGLFLLALWVCHLSAALLAFHVMGEGARHTTEYVYAFAGSAGATLMMFSVAWFLSAFLSGSALPFGLALGGAVASAEVLRQLIEKLRLHGYVFVRAWIVWSVVVAVTSFPGGV
jgi:hypothetical protein